MSKLKQETTICIICKKKFPKSYGKSRETPYAKCPICRRKHAIEQKNSIIKLHSNVLKKIGTIFDDIDSSISNKQDNDIDIKIVQRKCINNVIDELAILEKTI